ncbi:HAMP domain-containing sensor histidine kinase [Anaerolentibacter hominis]|uniref:sensor histidine kinase n=1 Tax=Anaerolentibacter hominis TaxID=3079009 RepID=UPI0031B85764
MLRNREFRQFAVMFIVMSAIAVTAGFIISWPAGILNASFAVASGTAVFLFNRARYQNIAQISSQIDLVLHNVDRIYIGEEEEGELSILRSEITKMTLRIREQNEALKKEKEHLSDSLADIAHQLRTPLTSANLILSLMGSSPDEHERKTLAREIEELLLHMDWLLTSLLKLSRLDAGIVVFQKERIDADSLIRTSLRPLLIPMELHEIEVITAVPAGIEIWGDSGWLSEAIQNILKNCMESAGDRGKIEISGTDNPLFAEITIHDSGPGFQTEDLSRLFERFYRGKNTDTAGYGIGLALCRMIITRQGGTITAKNHPLGGAAFTVRLPK